MPKNGEENLVNALKTANSPARTAYDNEIIAWESPEFVKHEKGALWFLIAGIFDIVIVVYALLSNSWTFAIAILILSGVYYMHHHVEPKNLRITLSEIGIKIGDKDYAYGDFEAFWIIYKPPFVKKLHLRTKKNFQPDMVISLENEDPAQIKNFLAKKIKEIEGKDETITEIFIRSLKL